MWTLSERKSRERKFDKAISLSEYFLQRIKMPIINIGEIKNLKL